MHLYKVLENKIKNQFDSNLVSSNDTDLDDKNVNSFLCEDKSTKYI